MLIDEAAWPNRMTGLVINDVTQITPNYLSHIICHTINEQFTNTVNTAITQPPSPDGVRSLMTNMSLHKSIKLQFYIKQFCPFSLDLNKTMHLTV